MKVLICSGYRWIVCILHILLAGVNCPGQTEVYGVIRDEHGAAVAGAFIQMTQTHNTKMTWFAESDSAGQWQMSVKSPGLYQFITRHLNFHTAYDSVFIDLKKESVTVEIRMQRKAHDLPEIVITDIQPGVSQKGDTLVYHIEKYSTGHEYTLGELLNTLPGLEYVDGEIRFRNRRVQKLLIQGKDILNDMHKLAGENLLAEHIRNVEIIENYQDVIDRGIQGDEHKVALNIILVPEVQRRLAGSVEAQAGTQEGYILRGHGMYVGDRFGATVFGGGNNIFYKPVSSADLLQLRLQGTSGSISPSEMQKYLESHGVFSGQAGTQYENALCLNNEIIGRRENHVLKISGMISSSRAWSSGLAGRLIVTTGNTLAGNFSTFNDEFLSMLNISHTFPLGKRHTLRVILPITYTRVAPEDVLNGALDSLDLHMQVKNDNRENRIAPQLVSVWSINTIYSLRTSIHTVYSEEHGRNDIGDIRSLFGTGAQQIMQNISDIGRSLKVETFLTGSPGRHYFGVGLQFNGEHDNLRISTYPDVWQGENAPEYQVAGGSTRLLVGYKTEHIMLEGELSGHLDELILPSLWKHRYDYLDGRVTFHYKPGRLQKIFMTLGRLHHVPDRSFLYPVNRIIDVTTIRTGSGDLYPLSRAVNATLGYYLLGGSSVTGYANLTMSFARDQLTWYVSGLNDVLLIRPFLASGVAAPGGSLMIRVNIRKIKSRIAFNTALRFSEGRTIAENMEVPTKLRTGHFRLEGRTQWKNRINFSVAYSNVFSSSVFHNLYSRKSYSEQIGQLSMTYKHGNLFVESGLQLHKPGFQKIFAVTTISGRYQLPYKGLSLKIEGYDLFGTMSKVNSTLSFTDTEIEFRSWKTRRSYFVAGVSYTFE